MKKKNKPPKVFFNASVILAGLSPPQGGSAKLLKLTKKKIIIGSISEIVFEETIRHAEKIGLTKKSVKNRLLSIFRNISLAPAKPEVENFKKIVIDYGDSHILASCRENRADFLVTLDKKHLLILDGKIKSLKIVSPGQLLKILSGAK